MIELSEYIDSIFITESFKSSILRDLIQTVKKTKDTIANGDRTTQILPKGVAWDQITDDEIEYGESMDKNFISKFINPNYLVIWYPLFSSELPLKRRRVYGPGTQTIDARYVFISFGKKIVYYNNKNRFWICKDVVRPSQHDVDIINQTTIQSYDIISKKGDVNKYDFHEFYQDLTVDKLSEYTISACIAIHKDVLIKYSTVQKMLDRLNQKRGAIAFDKEVVDDDYYKAPDKHSTGKFSKRLVDYPMMRIENLQRYKEELKNRGGASDESIIRFIDVIMARIKPFKEFFDSVSADMGRYENISALTGDKYIDMLFNSPNNEEAISFFNAARTSYVDIFRNLDKFVELTRSQKRSIAQMKDSYSYSCIEDAIKDTEKYINRVKEIMQKN